MNALNQHCTQKQCNKKSVQNCKSNMTDSEQATQRERLSSAVLPQSELTKRAVKRKKRNRKKKESVLLFRKNGFHGDNMTTDMTKQT